MSEFPDFIEDKGVIPEDKEVYLVKDGKESKAFWREILCNQTQFGDFIIRGGIAINGITDPHEAIKQLCAEFKGYEACRLSDKYKEKYEVYWRTLPELRKDGDYYSVYTKFTVICISYVDEVIIK